MIDSRDHPQINSSESHTYVLKQINSKDTKVRKQGRTQKEHHSPHRPSVKTGINKVSQKVYKACDANRDNDSNVQ